MKKKAIVLFLTLLLVFSLLSQELMIISFAEEINVPTIIIESAYGEFENQISVPIVIKNNPGIFAMLINIEYDSDKLELVNVENGDIFSQSSAMFGKNITANPYCLTWEDSLSTSNICTDGTMAVLTFNVKSDILFDSSEIIISYDEDSTFDTDLCDVHFETMSGNITLNSYLFESVPPCRFFEIQDSKYISGIEPGTTYVELMEESINYDNVDFQFDLSENKRLATEAVILIKPGPINTYISYTIVIFGDVNGDGWYDGTDAITVSCIANGMLTREQVGDAVWMAADCNHDGVIDQSDVDLLNQAGVLLSKVDQTQSEETLMADSLYVEYLHLIEQQVEVTSEETTKDNAETPIPDKWETFIRLIINLIKQIFSTIKIY